MQTINIKTILIRVLTRVVSKQLKLSTMIRTETVKRHVIQANNIEEEKRMIMKKYKEIKN